MLQHVPPKLIGIAKLAANSDLLEAKRRVDYREIETRHLVGRATGRKMPFDWTINPYRGCEFGCKYCYARYTHEFMELRESEQFERQIFAKRFSTASFRRELARVPPEQGICIGTATDPYQLAERRYGLTRKILLVLEGERGRTISLTTKSDLVARDAELLASIARRNVVHVFVTLTTVDAELARMLEPYAPEPRLRLAAVRSLAAAGVRVVILNSPVMPAINDSLGAMESVAEAARSAGAVYMMGGVLFLKPCARRAFFPFLEEKLPHLERGYRQRYAAGAFLRGDYADTMARQMRQVREKYGLVQRPDEYVPELWEGHAQLRLFE